MTDVTMLELPFPPSVNTYYRRGPHSTYLSPKGREYKQAVAEIVAAEGVPIRTGRLYVAIALSSPTKRAFDIDNRIKSVLDAMQDAGVFADDEQIDEINVVRRPQGGGWARVMVWEKEGGAA